MIEAQLYSNDGVWLYFHGPFPQLVIDLIEKPGTTFADRKIMVEWLGYHWPAWRESLIKEVTE